MATPGIKRTVVVTSALAFLGAAAGAVSASLALLAFGLVEGDLTVGAGGWWIYGVGAAIGAGYGAVLGPGLFWLVCRNAPLWRAIGEPALTASVASAAVLVSGYEDLVWSVPVVAALLAALRLRRETERTR